MSIHTTSRESRQESRIMRYDDLEGKYRYEIDDRVSRYVADMAQPGAKREFAAYAQGLPPEVARILYHELLIEDWSMQHQQLDARLQETYLELVEPSLLDTVFIKKSSLENTQPAATDGQSVPRIHGFELQEEIGRGGTAVVYRARQLRFDRTVAMKVPLRSGQDLDPSERKRFYDEARLQAKYLGAGVPAVFASSFGDYGVPYIAMEYVDGSQLKNFFPNGQPTRKECIEGFNRIAQVCRALAPMHRDETLHLDLSPGNVFFTKQDQVKILDFGFGYAAGLKPFDSVVAGTLDYMAPEKVQGEKRFKPTTDVFSLGAFLARMATGQTILPGGISDQEKLRRIEGGNYDEIRNRLKSAQQEHNLPAKLIDLTLKCIRTEPKDRPVDAAAVADRIEDFFKAEEEELQRLQVQQARQQIIRRSLFAVLGVLALGTIVSLSFGIWANIERKRAQRNVQLRVEALDTVIRIAAGDSLRKVGQTSVQKALLLQLIPLVDDAAKSDSSDRASLEQKAVALNSMTIIHIGMQQPDEALQAAQQAEAIARQLCQSSSVSATSEMALGTALSNLAYVEGMGGQFEAAIGHAEESSKQFSKLIGKGDTAYLRFRSSLVENTWANCLMRQVPSLPADQQPEGQQQAESHYRTALAHIDSGLTMSPQDSQYRAWRVKVLSNFALLTAEKPEGLQHAKNAVLYARQLLNDNPGDIDSREGLAVALTNEGTILTGGAVRRAKESIAPLSEALDLYIGLAAQVPMNIEFTWGTAMAHSNLGDALAATATSLAELEIAMEHLKKADAIYQEMLKVTPGNQELLLYVEENNQRVQAVTELIKKMTDSQ